MSGDRRDRLDISVPKTADAVLEIAKLVMAALVAGIRVLDNASTGRRRIGGTF